MVCVDDTNQRMGSTLTKGEIYTVEFSRQCSCGLLAVAIKGIKDAMFRAITSCPCGAKFNDFGYILHKGHRSRPIDEAFGENVPAAFEEQFAFAPDLRTEITA